MQRRDFFKTLTLATASFALAACPASSVPPEAGVSIRPGQVWRDTDGAPINAHSGCVIFQEGVYYWFGVHCVEGDAGNSAQVGVRAYSSRDLVTWKNEGVVLAVSEDPRSPIARDCLLERPKVIYNESTRRYVMWFHLEPKGQGYRGAQSAVAVAEHPAGPYRFVASFRPDAGTWPVNTPNALQKELNAEEARRLGRIHFIGGEVPDYPGDLIFRRDFRGGQMARDMTLFVDDDQRAYQVYASEENGTLHVSLLSDDYLRSAGKYARVLPGGFNEAPAVFKHGGRYWMVTSGCTGWAPNAARLAVADSIWGPWRQVGNPWIGEERDTESSFGTQSSSFLQTSRPDLVVYLADRWHPENPIEARYVWLPVDFREDGRPYLRWRDAWDPRTPLKPAP